VIKCDVALADSSSDENLLSSKIESNSSGRSQGTKTARNANFVLRYLRQ
jgi:hypothetical protein